jgi:hypothetical protein
VVIVSHSNAGLFVPAIVEAATRQVAGCLFVEARLPSPEGPARVTEPEFLESLRPKVTDGRLPLSYYEESIPVPAGWDDRPCGYLLFGPPYDPMARDARERGWTVEYLPGRHLHQLVDPETVTSRIVAMTRMTTSTSGAASPAPNCRPEAYKLSTMIHA